jgi:hypothetical protein
MSRKVAGLLCFLLLATSAHAAEIPDAAVDVVAPFELSPIAVEPPPPLFLANLPDVEVECFSWWSWFDGEACMTYGQESCASTCSFGIDELFAVGTQSCECFCCLQMN